VGKMKQLTGIIVSNKMQKTVVVRVDRIWRHPLYRKAVKRSKRYLVQADNVLAIGDKVIIGETRPTSGKKRWKIVKVIK
jgi:small subunit ribosomal protein S17